jgi:hypothetical protein
MYADGRTRATACGLNGVLRHSAIAASVRSRSGASTPDPPEALRGGPVTVVGRVENVVQPPLRLLPSSSDD